MKNARHFQTAAFAFLLATTPRASAQFALSWSTMDSGGSSGTAGPFALQSTLGQPDVGTGATGSFGFQGGYWSGVGEALPLLRIFRDGADIVLAWPNPSDGFILQASPSLAPTSWTGVALEPEKVGSELQLTWGPPAGRYFFRLHRP